MLAKRVHEPTRFLAAVATVARPTRAEALEALDRRLLELEYTRALQQAERDWLRAVVDDLRKGRLTWDFEALTRQPEAQHGPE